LLSEQHEIMQNGVRLEAIGELSKLPKYVKEPLDSIREVSADNRGMVLTLALSYGGQEELVSGMRTIAERVAQGVLRPETITLQTVHDVLWTRDLPPVDLVIRTSGEQRLSNFLLWHTAYAELVFSPVSWPDFRSQQFAEALLRFQTRERRFGLTGAQIRPVGT
jgi:undecaprenyl diphosphate synthase